MKRFLSTMLILSSVCLLSCNKNDEGGDEEDGWVKGVHKIEIKVTGDEEITHIASFVTAGGKVYNEAGEYQGDSYLVNTTFGEMDKIVCYTDNSSVNLTLSYSASTLNDSKATISVKCYIDGKLVDSIEKKTTFGDNHNVETITVGTHKVK